MNSPQRTALEAIKGSCDTALDSGAGAFTRAFVVNIDQIARHAMNQPDPEGGVELDALARELRDAIKLIWETTSLTHREAYTKKHDMALSALERERAQGHCDEARFILSFIRQHPILYRWLIEDTGENGKLFAISEDGPLIKPGWPVRVPIGISGEGDIQIESEEHDDHRFVALRWNRAKGGRQRILLSPGTAKGLAATLMMAAYGDET